MDEIRRNGGVPPPPEPLLPTEFTIQLYNPDQQIKVTSRSSSVLSTERFDFSMPQQTFRAPSTSLLDRSENDPTADANTPKINFTWKRESKLSKDLVCYLRGKSTDFTNKKKSKEPDITLALFRSLREITIYESNLQRVETEDPKGLEVVVLLAATAIKDIWFGNKRQVFNITEVSNRRSSSAANQSRPVGVVGQPDRRSPPVRPAGVAGSAALGALYAQGPPPPSQGQLPAASTSQAEPRQQTQTQRRPTDPPPADPRTQWEIDAETARLKAQVDAEERELRRREDARRRERERQDEEETKRLRKMVEAEERERQRRLKEAEKETKRLQKLYGSQAGGSAAPYTPANPSASAQQAPSRPHSTLGIPQYPQYPTPVPQVSGALPPPQPPRPTNTSTNPYLQPGGAGGPSYTGNSGRSGYLGSMLDLAERHTNKLSKKKSSVW